MTDPFIIIDGGTTNTRFCLLDRSQVIDTETVQAGAGSAVAPGSNPELVQAVRKTIRTLEEKHACKVREIFASGMITSPTGLHEVPHLAAPAGLTDLTQGIKRIVLPVISDAITFNFVPGIKAEEASTGLPEIIRGEETEVMGLLDSLPAAESDAEILHFGSHHKQIHVTDGKITAITSTLTGELFWAVRNHTILRSSLASTTEYAPVPAFVLAGFRAAETDGLSRTLFTARLQDLFAGASIHEVASYVYGAMVQGDVMAFAKKGLRGENPLILYGRSAFIRAFLICADTGGRDVRSLSYEESEGLSLRGMLRIIDALENGGAPT